MHRRFSTGTLDLQKLTREQALNWLEERQEATVLRYMRESSFDRMLERPVKHNVRVSDFRRLSNTEVAQIMMDEEAMLERELSTLVRD